MRPNIETCIDDKYFKNKDEQCFGISLANFFVFIGDGDMARKVYTDYRKHPLVLEDGGIFQWCYTRVVRDLTENKYSSLFHSVGRVDDSLESYRVLKSRYRENLINVLKAAKEEKEQGRLIILSEGIFRVCAPCILSIVSKYEIIQSENVHIIRETEKFTDGAHCIFFPGKETLIDGEDSFRYSNIEGLFRIEGFLQIYKT